ncbi:class A beta-lactamase-related serine hydrolase [Streptomyces odontomachi]|uniref:class A beta-lactamase-related serine hydrolase n=1 Tax=Streptomyces odontomachi TaxID=2944940 RepID=UPI00210881D4|nr:class A beta-lactamase-related serine hydrolase [Streptomyces sp. ODS25]
MKTPPTSGRRSRRALAAVALTGSALAALATATPAGAVTSAAPAAPAGVTSSEAWVGGAQVLCTSHRSGLAPRLAQDIAGSLRGRQGTSALALYDRSTATTCSLNADRAFDSASVVKATVLGALLRQAMDGHRTLTPREVALSTAMITKSDNAATSTLWRQIGHDGINRFLTLAGMRHTVPAADGRWGLSQVTAGDQLKLLQLLTSDNPVLDRPARTYALNLMRRVVPEQRWGVSAGAPGTAAVHLKNGWLPRTTHGWRVHSIGAFTDGGHDDGIVVLSQGDPTMDYGITTIQGASRVIHRDLGQAHVR